MPKSPIFKKRFLRREPSKEIQPGRQRLLLLKSNQNKQPDSGQGEQSQPAEEKRTESTLDDALKEIPLDQFSDLWQIITRISETTAGSSGHLQDTAYGTKRRQLPPNPTLAQVLGIAIE